MQKITVRLETVTPLFLGGAEGKNGPPELRPPAFRGAMRYWLRAVLGGVIGDNNLKGLHQLETAVLGSTDTGSPITVRVVQTRLIEKEFPILPHKSSPGRGHAFQPGQQFDLILQTSRMLEPIAWVNSAMALNLMLTFGGVGLRSRRGYGSMRVVGSSAPELIPVFPETVGKWKKRIELITRSAIAQAKKLAMLHEVDTVETKLKKSTKYPSIANGAILAISDEKFPGAIEAVVALMKKMPNERYVGYIGNGRQASPLWVRVIRVDGQYRLLFCVLPSQFPGADYKKLSDKVKEFASETIQIKGWNTND